VHKLLLFLHVCPVNQQPITRGLNQQDGRSDLISLFDELCEDWCRKWRQNYYDNSRFQFRKEF